MFQNYEIKQIGKEEVLFLYLDLNTEFASNQSQKKTTIKKEIKDYIEKKKIKFNGKKIILMAGSIIIGSLLFTTPLLKKDTLNFNNNYSVSIINTKENINDKERQNNSTKKEIENIREKENISSSNEIKTNTQTETIKNAIKISPSKETTKTAKEANINTISSTTSEKNLQNQNSLANNETKQMISIKRSNGTILYLELEEYLIGVVGAEMPASFHIEALKAQAIAARTYALKALENNTILTDSTSTQVYKDNNELKAMWKNNYATYYNKIKQAVSSTKGNVMTYNGKLINAFYHSTSNGYTEDSTTVFGTYPYLKSVESLVDEKVASYLKTITLSYEEISNKLGIPVTSLSTITTEKNNSNRINKIRIDNNTYDGIKFRTLLGLRSTDFEITLKEKEIAITTRGYGHGVGMSQYGANEYAKLGMNAEEILKHYYTGITIKKS